MLVVVLEGVSTSNEQKKEEGKSGREGKKHGKNLAFLFYSPARRNSYVILRAWLLSAKEV